jgi:hypothetical protein
MFSCSLNAGMMTETRIDAIKGYLPPKRQPNFLFLSYDGASPARNLSSARARFSVGKV